MEQGKLIIRDPQYQWRSMAARIALANGSHDITEGVRIALKNELARIERQQRREAAKEQAK